MVNKHASLPAAAVAVVAAAWAAGGCEVVAFGPPSPSVGDCDPLREEAGAPPTAVMAFDELGSDFFAAPFPAIGRNGIDGGADGYDFPSNTPMQFRLRGLLENQTNASISSAVFFELDGGVMPGSLLPRFTTPPSPASLSGDAGAFGIPTALPSVMLFPVDDPSLLATINVDVSSTTYPKADGSGTNTAYLLTAVPVQGRPLFENRDYVGIVTTRVARQAPFVRTLCHPTELQAAPPPGLTSGFATQYSTAIQHLPFGLTCDDVAAITLFHTSEPTAEIDSVQKLAHADFMSNEGACTFNLQRDGDENGPRCWQAPFCVYVGKVDMPDYQRGTPPYIPYVDWGGGWPTLPVPAPELGDALCRSDLGNSSARYDLTSWTPTWREARVVVTIPRSPPPTLDDGGTAAGYPVLVLVRAGAGTTTDPLVDRGPTLGPQCAETACRGPAEALQSVGYAGITIDGPLVGTSGVQPIEFDEDFGIFDVFNPEALRDNIRQSAVELTLVPDILQRITINLDDCQGTRGGQAVFDYSHLALFSHSMGSTISPLALATDSRFGAAILSGSGGSLIENGLYKKEPIPINTAGLLFGYASQGCHMSERDPELTLLQWSLEAADAEVYVRRLVTDDKPEGSTWSSPNARSVLMIQGLVDHYILPPIADVTILGAKLDLAVGPGSCNDDPSCDLEPVYGEVASPNYPTLPKLLPLSGGQVLPIADAGGNVPWPSSVPGPDGGATHDLTAVVVQHRIDENREPGTCIVDGHEVIYESLLARHQYACFLHDFLNEEAPEVRAEGDIFTAMHALGRISCVAPLCVLAIGSPARGGDSPSASSDAASETRLVEAQQDTNSHAYRDVPGWRSAPAAGTEFGYGVVIPSLGVPTYSFQGRLGVALETPERVALLLEGATGVTVAFNTGSNSPNYGYLVRIPLLFAPEIVYSRMVSSRRRNFMNFHFGLDVGGDFVLSASCLEQACNYILPSVYFAVGARAGLSFSSVERSAVGLFVSWQNDFAPCPPTSQNCATSLSTLMWSIGWSLF